MYGLTLYLTDSTSPINSTQFEQIIAQLSSYLPGASISVDNNSNIQLSSTAYNILSGNGVPLKALGQDNDRYFCLSNNTMYLKTGEWYALGTLNFVSAINTPYFINVNATPSTTTGATTPPAAVSNLQYTDNISLYRELQAGQITVAQFLNSLLSFPANQISLTNITNTPALPSTGYQIYVQNDTIYLATPTALYYLSSLQKSLPVSIPTVYTDSDFDSDEDTDMPLTPNNLTTPSQSTAVNGATSTNIIVTDLVALNATNSGSFKIEVYNSSNDLAYIVFGQGTLVNIDPLTSYQMEPTEKRVFVVPHGYTSITAILGVNAAVGHLRTTVEAAGS